MCNKFPGKIILKESVQNIKITGDTNRMTILASTEMSVNEFMVTLSVRLYCKFPLNYLILVSKKRFDSLHKQDSTLVLKLLLTFILIHALILNSIGYS
jgi:hypothetical protein